MGLVWGSARVSQYDLIKDGDRLAADGDHDGAVRHYSAALDIAPEYWVGYHKRAKAFQALGQRDLAIADATSAIALQDNIVARTLRAGLLRADGDEEGAAGDEAAAAQLREQCRRRKGPKPKSEMTEEERHWAEVEERQRTIQAAEPHNSRFAHMMRDRARRLRERQRRLASVQRPELAPSEGGGRPPPRGPRASVGGADEELQRLGGGV
eukprot:TRINITY_DN2927_c1_g1_i1.p1 TRINITY_DN2927_c1_g1~~TRINITY_DN2927_c1_g1_i1.p1  ORF type:complete len:239 (+),score=80.06 TRINITY_DN2927_c1_g1_i1:88-717(+)